MRTLFFLTWLILHPSKSLHKIDINYKNSPAIDGDLNDEHPRYYKGAPFSLSPTTWFF